MDIIDSGHDYLLHSFDGGEPIRLTFVKRNDPPEKYPGNDNAYPGTQIQEVSRALIERVQYVDGQIPHPANKTVLYFLREIIYLFEIRHAQQHSFKLPHLQFDLENIPFCQTCGHIACFCEPVAGEPS